MSSPFARLTESFVLKITGADARRIVNNLTTNNIAELPENSSCETFVTNGKGWVVAHGFAFAFEDDQEKGIWLAGQHPDPASIAAHIDRYVIREDVTITDASASHAILLVDQSVASQHLQLGALEHSGFQFVLLDNSTAEVLCQSAEELPSEQVEAFRIRAAWPRQGSEIQEKTIPQELDRDKTAISFTKGCYLGQETIARLDALGQLQRKLCVLTCVAPTSTTNIGDELERDGKVVGKLSSVAQRKGELVGLATIKRGSFEKGTELTAGGNVWQVI